MPRSPRRSRSGRRIRNSPSRSPRRSPRRSPLRTDSRRGNSSRCASRSPDRSRKSSQSPRRSDAKRRAESCKDEVVDSRPRGSDKAGKQEEIKPSNARVSTDDVKEHKKDKKKSKDKKEAKKAKKKAKKAKKELKKAKKELKKAQQMKKDKKAESASSDSSSASSSSGSVDIEFVLGSQYGKQGKADAHNPEARISQWLGLSQAACGMSTFVGRDDDADIIKEIREAKISRDANGKRLEDRRHDWICPQLKADGSVCEARNFQMNDRCFQCRSLKPKNAMLARDYQQKTANIEQQHGRGTYNGKICSSWKGGPK